MSKIILYSAMSLNGKIAQSDGSVAWLENIPNPDKTDYGYAAFYKNLGATIMGYKTYKQVIDWGIEFPYPDTTNYVITRKKDLEDTAHVQFITEQPVEFCKDLKQKSNKDIWLIGGGGVNALLLEAKLIDEMHLHIMPIILTDGIDLFSYIQEQTQMELLSSTAYNGGVTEVKYRLR